jgi:hypothetical protein
MVDFPSRCLDPYGMIQQTQIPQCKREPEPERTLMQTLLFRFPVDVDAHIGSHQGMTICPDLRQMTWRIGRRIRSANVVENYVHESHIDIRRTTY